MNLVKPFFKDSIIQFQYVAFHCQNKNDETAFLKMTDLWLWDSEFSQQWIWRVSSSWMWHHSIWPTGTIVSAELSCSTDGSSRILWNSGGYLPNYKASHSRQPSLCICRSYNEYFFRWEWRASNYSGRWTGSDCKHTPVHVVKYCPFTF